MRRIHALVAPLHIHLTERHGNILMRLILSLSLSSQCLIWIMYRCFSLFGQFGQTYSCWPVILTSYNLPPWLCMKKPYMFLSLLIPRPKAPKGNFDIYIQPLIEELKQLWTVGVQTYDASMEQNFVMKAVILWTIYK